MRRALPLLLVFAVLGGGSVFSSRQQSLAAASALPAPSTPSTTKMASSMPPGGGGAVPRIEDPPLPPAYLPTATVKSFAVASPTKALAAGSFQLTPARCSGAGCSGFRVSNTPDYSSRVNAATFAPAPKPLQVDPWNPQTYEIGSLTLTNAGFMVPADAGTALVPITADLTVATQGTGKSTPVSLPFLVNWSPGSPAPPNTAGLFVLVTRASGSVPAPTRDFSVNMAPGIDVALRLELLGFVADAAKGKDVTVLGDWGASEAPKLGQPGPRVSVKQGAGPQVVKLVARISKVA